MLDEGSDQLACTVSIIAVHSDVLLCDVTASPSSSGPDMPPMVTVEPGTAVHVPLPGDVYAVNVVAERATSRWAGTAPAGMERCTVVVPPAVDRNDTTMPLPGVTNRA